MSSATEQRAAILRVLDAAEAKLAGFERWPTHRRDPGRQTESGSWVTTGQMITEEIPLTWHEGDDGWSPGGTRDLPKALTQAIRLTRNTYGALLTCMRGMLPTAVMLEAAAPMLGPFGPDCPYSGNERAWALRVESDLRDIARAADAIAAELAGDEHD